MSVPVAGRRKGLATTASPTFSSPVPAPSVPSWLDDGDDGSTAPAAASSAYSPVTASARHPSPTTNTITATNAAFASPVAEDEGDLPAFLRDDAPARQAQQQQQQALFSAPPPLAMTAGPGPSAAALEAAEQRRAALAEELAALTDELAAATRRVELLQGESHSAAAEVKELDTTLAALRAKESEGRRRKEERDAQAHRAAAAASAEEAQTSLETATSAFRAECHERFQQELSQLNEQLAAQQSTNASLQRECEEVMSTTPEARCQTVAFDALQRRMQDGVRHLRQHFSQQCSSTVALSARTFLASACAQREEAFASDAARRARQLDHYRSGRETSMTAFHEECRTVFQNRTDALFGSLKAELEKRRLQNDYERQQRLSAFHARLHTMTERGRATVEQQLRVRQEREHAISAAQRDAAGKELALRLEELQQQRRLFLSRAEAEYQSLRATRRESSVQGGPATATSLSSLPFRGAASSSSATPQSTLESLKREADSAQTRLQQLALTLRTRQQKAQSSWSSPLTHSHAHGQAFATPPSSSSPPGRHQLGYSFSTPALSVDVVAARWRDSLLSLQQRRELLRRVIAELTASTHTCSDAVQRGRGRLAEQREEGRRVRGEWEGRVRRELATCLTTRNPQLPAPASLTTSALEGLQGRVQDLLQSQAALRTLRGTFAAEVSTWVQRVHDYRSSSERVLSSTFAQLEVLRDKSVQAELDKAVLQTMHTRVEALHHRVSEEASRLAVQKRSLDALVKKVRAGLPIAAVLPSYPVPSTDTHSPIQSTLIFDGPKSPLVDVTNATQHRLNCNPRPERNTVGEGDAGRLTTTSSSSQSAAAQQQKLQQRLVSSSASTAKSTAVVTAVSGGGDGAEPRSAQGARLHTGVGERPTATTTMFTASGIDLFGSNSPSPVMPSLEGHSGWLLQHPPSASGADISVSPQTVEAVERPCRRSVDSEVDFTTELEPLEEDTESDIDLLRYR